MKQITLEEALKLVSFCYEGFMGWQVRDVKCDVWGDVHGNVRGGVHGDVRGDIWGVVRGTISSGGWQLVESPAKKLQRLVTESGDQELIDIFNQMEDS